MREINKISEALFEKIRDRFEDVTLGDENAKATQSPEDARFFNFDYTVDGNSHGNITISVIDENSLKVYFSKNISSDLDEEEKAKWYGFLRELREFAKRNLLSFEPRDITRSTLKHRDLQQVSKSDSTYSKDEVIGEGYKTELAKSLAQKAANFAIDAFTDNVVDNETNHTNPWGTTDFDKRMEKIRARQAREKARSVSESRMHGTSRSSYEQDGNVKIIVRHSDKVDPEQRGARSRKIKALFIETADGARIKLPHNNLKYARAMAQHITQGGEAGDDFGQHITKIAEECSKLRPFKSAMVRRTFEDAETQSMAEAAFEYHGLLNDTLKKMSGRKGYAACKESFVADDVLMDEFDVDALRERFVKRSFNDRMEDALPLVQKAYNMKKSNNFAQQFESWANTISEGTWAIPDTEEQVSELTDLLMEPLPVGVDATNATNALYNLIGDDTLFDNLGVLADENSEADARDVVMDWIQENMPDIYQQIMSVIGDEDPADQTVEPELDEGYDDEESDSSDAVQAAIIRRIINSHSDLLSQYGPEAITNATKDVADWVGNVEEIGSSDVSAWVAQVKQALNGNNEIEFERDRDEPDQDVGSDMQFDQDIDIDGPDQFNRGGEMDEGIVDTIRGYNYKRLANRSAEKAKELSPRSWPTPAQAVAHQHDWTDSIDANTKSLERKQKAKSLGVDESKMSDMDIDINELTDQEFLEKYNHTKQQAIDGDWENHYEPETMPEPTDESIGDDYVNKDVKMKQMGAKDLSTLDKVKIMPSQMKAMAKGDDEGDLTAYNKQFNEEIAQMRKIAGIGK